MDLLAYFRVLRRHWRLIVATTLAGAALGAGSAYLSRDQADASVYYRATHTLVVSGGSTGGQPDGSAPRHYSNPIQIQTSTTSGEVPGAVARTLGTADSPRDLAAHVTTRYNREGASIELTAIDSDPQRAALLADTFASELIASLAGKEEAAYTSDLDAVSARVQRLETERDELFAEVVASPQDEFLQSRYDATAQRYGQAYGQYVQLVVAGPPTPAVTTLEPAQPIPIGRGEYRTLLRAGELGRNHFQVGDDDSGVVVPASGSSFDDPVPRGVLGGILGFLAGIGLALVAHKLDRRLRSREDVEAAFELPVLAEVPKLSSSQQRQHEVVAVSSPLSRAAEAYRAVRTSVLFQQAAVIASERGSGATGNGAGHDAAGTADALFEPAQNEPFVVMVTSASPREGKTTTSANLAAVFAEAGSSVLLLNCDFRRPSVHEMFRVPDEPRTVQETAVPGLRIVTNVLTDPTANPAQVVAAQRQVIGAARGRFDVVVLDTAPLLTANDAVEVVGVADLVLLVARPELTTTDAAQRAMDLLNRVDAPLSGVVLVAASGAADDSAYYYYQRGRVPEVAGRRRRARAARANGGAVPPAVTTDLFEASERSGEPRSG